MSPEFIIRIIVRARNEIAGVLDRAAGDVDKLTKAQDRQASTGQRVVKSNKDLSTSMQALRKDYDDFISSVKKGDRSTDDAVFGLRRFRQEFEKLSRQAKAGSDVGMELNRAAQTAQRASDIIEKESNRQKQIQRDLLNSGKKVSAEMIADHEARIRKQLEAEEAAAARRKALAQEIVDAVHARDAEQLANMRKLSDDEIKEATRVETARNALRQQRAQAEKSSEDAILRQNKALQDQRRELERATSAYEEFRKSVEKGSIAGERASVGLRQHSAELRRQSRGFGAGSSEALGAGVLAAEANKLAKEIDHVGDSANRNRGFLARLFNIDPGRIEAINNELHKFEAYSNRGGFSAVRFAGNLRGMVIVGLLAFFQQLIGIGISLGGTLVSIAGAAIQAGGALAGLATAAAAQAIPAIGLLVAAWGRVGAVFDALKAQQKARLASAYDEQQTTKRQTSAADSMRSAQQSLVDSQRQATYAQENLTKARKEAADQIIDLVNAEKQAELQAESARLSLENSRKTFSASLASGNVDDLAANALQVRSDSLQTVTSSVQSFRARRDATHAVRVGVEGMDNVVAARRAVDDANRSIARAREGLKSAASSAGDTALQVGSADRVLGQLLSDLSPAERKLYEVLKSVRDRYRKIFTGSGGVLEPIINSFSEVGRKALDLLNDPKLISAARGLARALGTEIGKFTDFLSSPAMRNFMEDMAKQASHNLPIVTSLLEKVVTLLMNVAEAGGPALTKFLTFLDQMMTSADDATADGSGMSKLQNFFMRGEHYAEQIVHLTGAIARLFLALTGASASQGNSAIEALTNGIQKATDWINAHRSDVAKFFSDALRATGAVLKALGELTKVLFGMFKPDQVEEFSQAFSKSLLPALADVLKVTGKIASIFLKFASSPIGSVLSRLAITTFLLNKGLSPIVSLGGKLITLFGTLTGRVRIVQAGLGLMKLRLSPLWIAFMAIVSAVTILSGKIHSVGGALKVVGVIVAGLTIALGRAGLVLMVAALVTQLERLAAVAVAGRLGMIVAIFTGLVGKVASLLRMLPGVTSALGAMEAEAGAAGAASAVSSTAGGAAVRMTSTAAGEAAVGTEAAAAAEGTALAGGLKFGISALLKKAGWIGVGISAAQGIISGFKHHSVQAGLQDFLHSITFGLVKSADQIASEAASSLSNRLKKLPIGRELNTNRTIADRLGSQYKNTPFGSMAGNKATEEYNKLFRSSDPKKDLKTAFDEIVDMRRRLSSYMNQGVSKNVFDYYYQSLQNFAKSAPPQFQGVLQQMLDQAKDYKKKIDKVFERKVTLFELLGDFGAELQKKKPNFDKALKDFMAGVQKLPPQMRGRAREMALNIAQGLEDQKKIPADKANDLASGITKAFTKMHKNTVHQVKAMATRTDAITNALGLALGSKYTWYADEANTALKAMGADKRVKFRLPQAPPSIAFGGDLESQTADLTGAASGGWQGRKGERGGDFLPRWLGRGEAVLNWAHQRVIEPGLAYAKAHGFPFGSLSEVFSKIKGEHGSRGFAGMAAGGFVPMPGTNFSVGDEPKIAADLSRLGRLLHTTIYGISGYRSPQHSVDVGGFADDPHTRGQAADIGVGSALLSSAARLTDSVLRRVGLFRPFYPADPHEINHVQLLGSSGGLGAVVGAAASAAVHKLRMLQVEGSGGNADLARAALRLVVGAGNRLINNNGGGLSIPGGGLGGDATANLRIGKKMAAAIHWVGAQWTALKQLWTGESGWRKNAKNPSSGAYGIPQSLPGDKMASAGKDWLTNASTQIRWGMRYIKQRYGNPVAALQAWLSRSPHWYEQGGAVPGKGPVGAVLHGDEHVWTAGEVARAGGHSVMRMLRRMLGGGGQGGPQGYQSGGRVLYIGDSLAVGTRSGLSRRLGGHVDTDAEVGRTSSRAVDILKTKLSKAYKQVILDVGTNDATAKAFAHSLKRAYSIVGSDRSLVLSTVNGPHAAQKNQVLRQFASQHSNVTISDWAGYVASHHLQLSQGIHGQYGQRAAVLAAAARSGARTSGAGAYQEPTIHGLDFRSIMQQLDRAEKIARGFTSKTIDVKKFTDALSRTFQRIVGTDGLLDQLSAAITNLSDKLDLNLRLATFKLTKAGNVVQRLGPVKIADQTAANLEKVRTQLFGEQSELEKQVGDITRRLANDKLSSRERAYLIGIRRNIAKRLQDVHGQIADNLQAAYDAVSQQISSRVDRASNTAATKTGRVDLIQRMRDMMGGTLISGLAGLSGRRGGSNLLTGSSEQLGQSRADALNQQADALSKAAQFARRKGHGKEADALLAQIDDLRQQALEAVQAGIQADVDEIQRKTTRKTTALDIRGRIATALGKVGDVGQIATDRINVINDQISQLKDKQKQAGAKGFGALAEQIGDQISELQTQVTEITAQALQDSIDQVNNAASRKSSQLDIKDRLANLKQSAGDFAGAFADRGNILAQRGQNLQSQRDALNNLLTIAALQGNEGQVNSLTDQISELDTEMAENTAAIKANTTAARQAAIDAITGRGSFLAGTYGGLGGLVSAIGALTGSTDTSRQGGILQQIINTNKQTLSGLEDKLFSIFGVDARGKSGLDLVDILRNLNYDGIEANLSPDDKTQFENLISAIIENATAVTTNTDQLNQLNGNTTQSFSSTAWQWFRNAIFNGSGGLLPAYNIPHMDTGGRILTDGLIYGHSGEEIVKAAQVARGEGGGGDTILQVTNPTEILDPGYVAEVLHFKRSTRRAS